MNRIVAPNSPRRGLTQGISLAAPVAQYGIHIPVFQSPSDPEPGRDGGDSLATAVPCPLDGVTNYHKVHDQRWAASFGIAKSSISASG